MSSKAAFGGWRRWAASGALTVTAYIGGVGLVAPVCYWQGRAWSRGLPFQFLAWDPKAEPFMWLILSLAAGWALSWSLFSMGEVRRRHAWLTIGAPLLAFVLSAFEASRMSYACNPI